MEGAIEKRAAIFWRIVSTILFVAMVTVNALANALPINGLTTGDVADLYPSLFTPAGVTFSIWSAIYLLVAAFLVFCWKHVEAESITRLLPAFSVSCIFNMSWIIVWHNLLPALSVAIMLLLLLTLIALFRSIQHNVPRTRSNIFLVAAPFSVYLAWICVATIANIAAWLNSIQGNVLAASPEIWTIVMMIVAAALAVRLFLKYQSPEFTAVVGWALLGIFLRWNGSEYNIVQYGSLLLLALLLGITVFALIRKPVRR